MLTLIVTTRSEEEADRLHPFGDDVPEIVSLDRLIRTVHMLNYLPLSHDEGSLFLPVHPRHVLTVERDHGAYFQEIILRLDTQLLIEGVNTEADAQLAQTLGADFVQGEWYEEFGKDALPGPGESTLRRSASSR